MLLLVTFALLLLTGPQYIRYIVYTVVDERKTTKSYAFFILFVHVSNKLSFCNSSVNFFLYCFGGSKFRRETLALVTCKQLQSGDMISSSHKTKQRRNTTASPFSTAAASSTMNLNDPHTKFTYLSRATSRVYPEGQPGSILEPEPSAYHP